MKVALVSSPGQYWNLIEYLNYSKISCSEIYLFYYYHNNESKLVKDYPFINSFKRVELISQTKGFYWRYSIICTGIKFFFNSVDTLISGQYWAPYHKFLINTSRPNYLITLDDGNANINWTHREIFNVLRSKNKIQFTSLSLFGENVIYNQFAYLQQTVIKLPVNSNTIFIIGSPYIQDGLMSKDNYNRMIVKILSDNNESQIWYIPHRREKQLDLNSKILQRVIYYEDEGCIEFMLFKIDFLPNEVHGFISSALGTLKKILPCECTIVSHLPEKTDFKKDANYMLYKEIWNGYRIKGIQCFK